MRAIEAAEFVSRIFKTAVEDAKLTGAVDIRIDASQGSLCNVRMAITEAKISVYEIGTKKKD